MAESKGRNRPSPAPEAPAAELEAALPVGGAALQSTLAGVSPVGITGGGITADGATLPAGMFGGVLSGDANAADNLRKVAPTFGEVLKSIGLAVAETQAALDKTLADTVTALSETTITVVTDVVQAIDEDGLPDLSNSEIITEDVSLANFMEPTAHAFDHVGVSMDLSVGEMSSSQGFTFNQKQTSVNVGGGWFSIFGGFASGSASHSRTKLEVDNSQSTAWSTGRVRVDAQLSARPTDKLPVGAEIAIGPIISYSQGEAKETKQNGAARRTVDVTLEVRKETGVANPGKTLEVDVSPFSFSFAGSGGFTGSTTNTDGKVRLVLTRDVPAGATAPVRGTIRVKLGEVRRKFEISL
jgi:hypothetical protein